MAGRNYSKTTLKRLYSGSGNQCSFPDCENQLFQREDSDTNVSEICHIEALSEGAARYNPNNKQPNDYDNLILLCRIHHKIIDDKKAGGAYKYSVSDLKRMKREHELLVDTRMIAQSSSLLNQVIKVLAKTPNSEMRDKKPKPFEIERKLEFNEVSRNKRLVEKYAVYSPHLDGLYDQLQVHEHETLLDNLNDDYLEHWEEGGSSDTIWESIESALIQQMNNEGGINYSEELKQAVRMIMVHGFMKCKILEEPQT